MLELLKVQTMARNPCEIILNISDDACIRFGFKHGEVVSRPDGLDAIIMGVAKGNERQDVLWYTIVHPTIKGKVCYWGGDKNLLKAGFKKKTV